MGEAKRNREAVRDEFGDSELWKVTDGAERVLRRERLKELHLQRLIAELASCPVCKRAAKLVVFGREGHGVWIGCDRSSECSRYIEYHSEGWSIEEVAREWNFRNKGINRVIRQIKGWARRSFSGEYRAERAKRREEEAEKAAEKAEKKERYRVKLAHTSYFERVKRKITNLIDKIRRRKKRW